MKDMVDLIIKYEEGKATKREVIRLFQHLINTGQAWKMQGHYGRTAMAMLEEGIIQSPDVKNPMNSVDFYGNQIKFPKASLTKAKVRQKLRGRK